MIYQLQKKFILISGASLLAVFAAIFGLIFGLSTRQLNQAMDELTDRISLHGGQSPVFDDAHRPPADRIPPDFITPETKFSTRFSPWISRRTVPSRRFTSMQWRRSRNRRRRRWRRLRWAADPLAGSTISATAFA